MQQHPSPPSNTPTRTRKFLLKPAPGQLEASVPISPSQITLDAPNPPQHFFASLDMIHLHPRTPFISFGRRSFNTATSPGSSCPVLYLLIHFHREMREWFLNSGITPLMTDELDQWWWRHSVLGAHSSSVTYVVWCEWDWQICLFLGWLFLFVL